MIGLIGPADSVELVVRVAREIDLQPLLIPRSYRHAEQATAIARDIEGLCSVILFTGRVPYVMAAASGKLTVRTAYIPHEGTDLYRAIAGILLSPNHRGKLPRASFDSIEALQVSEAFQELGLDPPQHILPLHDDTRDRFIDVTQIADEHHRLFTAGQVELCVTCIGDVHRRLLSLKAPAIRIVHSRIVVREALLRARLSIDLSRAEASQVAVCVMQVCNERKKWRRALSQRLLVTVARKYADLLDGRVISQRQGELVILTTRGAVERSFQEEIASRASAMKTELREHLKLGIGFGATASLAEANARRAVEAADGAGQHMLIAPDDQTIMPLEVVRQGDAREQRAQNLRAARQLNLSPTIIRRMRAAFRQLDPTTFTSNELASTYGVIPRSARRLIATLRERGLVEESGIEKSDGAGRPQIAYRIALDRLTEDN
jgi:hypothetical protein